MQKSLNVILQSRWFQIGVLLRLFLLLAVPVTYVDWFLPFLDNANSTMLFDPWKAHLQSGGLPEAFPYGLITYWFTLPLTQLGVVIEGFTGLMFLPALGLGITIFLIDAVTLWILCSFNQHWKRQVILLYWLSPISLYVSYWHGQIDIIPVMFILLATQMITRGQYHIAAISLALAVSAKFSFVLAVPVFLIFLFRHPRRAEAGLSFSLTLLFALAVFTLPTIASSSAREMVFGTSEVSKIFEYSILLTNQLETYFIIPVYVFLLFGAWWVKRISTELMLAFLGSIFLIIVTMTPASPGWYLWAIPFLAVVFNESKLRIIGLMHIYSGLFLAFHLLHSSGAQWVNFDPIISLTAIQNFILLDEHLSSIILSCLFTVGALLAVLLIREGILKNDYFRLSREPLMIGISGDSGTGKDTLADAIIDLMGPQIAVNISGDDYHNWDRHKPMWKVMSHLNPKANELAQMRKDVLSLHASQNIRKRHYDHSTGKMSKPVSIRSNDVIIASGLHTLFDPVLYQRFDVRIFLDMDEDLRRYFKIRRDVLERGHTVEACLNAIEQRLPDRNKFILPQAKNADMILQVLPVSKARLGDPITSTELTALKLKAEIRVGTPYQSLVKLLITICGAHVDVFEGNEDGSVRLEIDCDMYAPDAKLISDQLFAHLGEILPRDPEWGDGMIGLMQLMVLNQVSHSLGKRN